MKNNCSRFFAVFMAIVLLVSSFGITSFAETNEEVEIAVTSTTNEKYPYLTSNSIDPETTSNSVIIPGVFQSRVRLYNDDGTEAKNSEGKSYSAPFFLESTGDIVKKALKEVLVPLLLTLFTQRDWGNKLAEGLGNVIGWAVGEKAQNTAKGEMVYNVKADKYEGSVATLSEEDKEYIYDQIPLQDYADIVGEDHLYFYSYCSLSNIDSIVDELYVYIKKAASESPTKKTNIVPISQGGSLANNLLERYPDVGQYLDRIIYIVPALDGTVLLGDIYAKGIIDDDSALYDEIFPILINDDNTPWLGSLINIVLRIFPNSVLNNILDVAVDTLIEDYIKYDTTMWALVNQDNYLEAANKYLDDPEDAFIRAQTDRMYQAQINSDKNIMYQIDTYGVEVFDVVDYNYALYPIADSWNQVNGDGIIQLDSTSMGAYSLGVDVQLPDDYVPVKGEKYVDSYRIVDAGAGLLPDQTFYFHNQDHEKTASNDVIMKLAICLLTDKDFTSIDSYPDKYPQFNEARRFKNLKSDIENAKSIDTSKLSPEDAAELAAAIAEAEAEYNNTVVNTEKSEAAKKRLYAICDKINGNVEKETVGDKISDNLNNSLNTVITAIAKLLYKTIGGKGFSDIFKIF